LINREKEKKQR